MRSKSQNKRLFWGSGRTSTAAKQEAESSVQRLSLLTFWRTDSGRSRYQICNKKRLAFKEDKLQRTFNKFATVKTSLWSSKSIVWSICRFRFCRTFTATSQRKGWLKVELDFAWRSPDSLKIPSLRKASCLYKQVLNCTSILGTVYPSRCIHYQRINKEKVLPTSVTNSRVVGSAPNTPTLHLTFTVICFRMRPTLQLSLFSLDLSYLL